MVEDVQKGDLAVLFSQADPEGVDELEDARVEEYVTDVDVLQSLGTSVILADGL